MDVECSAYLTVKNIMVQSAKSQEHFHILSNSWKSNVVFNIDLMLKCRK